MAREIVGIYKGEGLRIAIVVSRFNDFVTSRLLEGAIDYLERHGVASADISVVWVPGAWEIPPVARRLAIPEGDPAADGYDAVLCLGAVIRGATPHFDYVSARVASGVADVGDCADVPVIFGVLTCDNLEQAIERAGSKAGNKGADTAMAAIEMVHVYRALREGKA